MCLLFGGFSPVVDRFNWCDVRSGLLLPMIVKRQWLRSKWPCGVYHEFPICVVAVSLGWGFDIEWTPDCLNCNHSVYLNSLRGPLKHFNFCSYISHVMKSCSTLGRKKSSLVKALGC